MCGILLHLRKKTANKEINNNDAFIESLSSRGPDSNGIINFNNISLIHTRLAIQDETDNGIQPYEFNDCIIIFNGEIYNYKVLEKEFNLQVDLDTDLIIKLYQNNKNTFFNEILPKFDGIFSFIILDKTLNKFFVVRDMVGVKPLYYYDDSEFLCISSSIKSFSNLINFEMNKNNVYEFWNFRQCLNNKTILNNVENFKNSHYYEFDLNGNLISKKKYTNFEEQKKMEYSLNILKEKVNNSIEYNLISDPNVKVGFFLSGGLDSSYIYNYCKIKKNNLYSYSIGFKNCNEFEYVNKLINHESKHKNIEISIEEYLDIMVDLIDNKGYVLQVPNEVLISRICKEARHDCLKVLVGGEGADELFHGYGRIFNLFLKNTDEDFIESFINEYRYSKDDNLFKFKYDKQNIYNFFKQFDNDEIHKQDLISKIFLNFHIEGLTTRLDSGSMHNSIESRVPFLNQSLIKYVYNNVPRKEKIKRDYDENIKYTDYKNLSENKDIPKYCLKKIAEEILPFENIYRKKVGFIVPIEDIDNKFVRNLVFKILSKGYINKYNFFSKKNIYDKIFSKSKELKYIIFNLINFEIFIQLFIEKIHINKVKTFILNKDFTVGYTCGCYDMFHYGHLNLLKEAKKQCDFLIVAVTTDEKVAYKGKTAIIKESDRKAIVQACKYVDTTIYQTDHDKFEAWKKLKYDALIVGDDWKGHENWNKWEKQLNEVGSRVHYIPYTKEISSTKLRNKLKK